jgi:tetratricopeptide (TPR) repeat protein
VTDDRAPSAWERALAAFHEGDLMDAEQILEAAIAVAEATHGRDSLEHGEAWFQLASLLAGMGDHERGIDALQTALDLDLPGEDGQRDALTYNMNLGEFLVRADRLQEAAQVLDDGLKGRAALYGNDHPGYAFGLEPLADVHLALDDAEGALARFDQCLQIFWEAGHPRVTTALAGRAFALCALDVDDLLDPVDQLPDELVGDVLDAILERAERTPSLDALVVLDSAVDLAESRCKRRLRDVLVTQSNVAQQVGDLETRIETLTHLLPIAQSDGEAIDLLQALALAFSEGSNHGEAEKAYVRAVAAAEELGDPGFKSRTQRNAGLYLSDRGRDAEAERLLRAAVDQARGADLLPELGRGLIALGIFLQHRDRLEDAQAALAEGTTLLPPDDRDWLTGRSHLTAIQNSDGCGCGDMDGALSDALLALVAPHVADDLLESLQVQMTSDGPSVSVELARDAENAELKRLNQAIRQGLAQLQSADED